MELDGKHYGGFQASKEENQQQVHEQKPTQRRKSYGFQLLTSVDDSDEDDLDGLPGISASKERFLGFWQLFDVSLLLERNKPYV